MKNMGKTLQCGLIAFVLSSSCARQLYGAGEAKLPTSKEIVNGLTVFNYLGNKDLSKTMSKSMSALYANATKIDDAVRHFKILEDKIKKYAATVQYGYKGGDILVTSLFGEMNNVCQKGDGLTSSDITQAIDKTKTTLNIWNSRKKSFYQKKSSTDKFITVLIDIAEQFIQKLYRKK